MIENNKAMESKNIKVKDFTGTSLGLFKDGEFINCDADWTNLKNMAVNLTFNSGEKHNISFIEFEGPDDDPVIIEGKQLFAFTRLYDSVYIIDVAK